MRKLSGRLPKRIELNIPTNVGEASCKITRKTADFGISPTPGFKTSVEIKDRKGKVSTNGYIDIVEYRKRYRI